jgi:hypothetical protein
VTQEDNFQKALECFENLLKTENLENYMYENECKDFIKMILSIVQYTKSHYDEKNFGLLPFDDPTMRTIGFVAYHNKDDNELGRKWWIKLTDLHNCKSPIHEFARTPENRRKSSAILWLAAKDPEHFHDNLQVFLVHNS